MKQHYYIISSIILHLVAISILYSFSEKPNRKKNGFERKIIKKNFTTVLNKKIGSEFLNIVGTDKGRIILSGLHPGSFLITDNKLKSAQRIDFKLPKTLSAPQYSYEIGSDEVLIMAKTLPGKISCNIDSKNYSIQKVPENFHQSCFVNQNLMAFSFVRKLNDSIDFQIGTYSFFKNEIKLDKSLLSYKNDGGFYNDGKMMYDSLNNLILYVTYYRNEIILFDTNLVLISLMHSIDTFSHSNIKVVKQNKGAGNSYFSLAAPPIQVNGKCCVDNGYLYVCSKIKADNEKNELFLNSTVVDIYNIKNRNYESSFYLPRYNGKEEADLKVMNGKILMTTKDGVAFLFQ